MAELSPGPSSARVLPLPWQAAAWRGLMAQRRAGRLPHALLLRGAAGIGKGWFAYHLAHALLCEAPEAQDAPCGRCRGCTQHLSGNHPDCVVLRPDAGAGGAFANYPAQDCQADRAAGASVTTVDQARELIGRLSLSTHYGGVRIGVLLPAEALNEAAANALLKLIEEPPPGSVLLLVSDRPGLLPATVRSRCQALTLAGPDCAQALGWLARHAPQHRSAHALALELAQGAPLLALTLAEYDLPALWQAVSGGLEAVLSHGDPLPVAQAWQAYPPELLERAIYAWLARTLRPGPASTLESAHTARAQPPAWEQLVVVLDELEALRRHARTALSRPLAYEAALVRIAQAVPGAQGARA